MTLFFFIFLIIGAHTASVAGEAARAPFDTLRRMSDVLISNHADINSWTIYARTKSNSNVTLDTFQQRAQGLKTNFSGFNWETVNKEGSHYLEIKGQNVLDKAVESITYFAYPQKSGYHTYLVYEIEGKHWNRHTWQTFSPTVDQRMNTLFGEMSSKAEVFTSVKARQEKLASTQLAEMAKSYSDAFNAEVVERVHEKTFVSLSAYTALWHNAIVTGDHKMNVQIALRNTETSTMVTLGTPIITTEY